jgi:hypothetical protein
VREFNSGGGFDFIDCSNNPIEILNVISVKQIIYNNTKLKSILFPECEMMRCDRQQFVHVEEHKKKRAEIVKDKLDKKKMDIGIIPQIFYKKILENCDIGYLCEENEKKRENMMNLDCGRIP